MYKFIIFVTILSLVPIYKTSASTVPSGCPYSIIDFTDPLLIITAITMLSVGLVVGFLLGRKKSQDFKKLK
ncbi:MAG: hypothetical protein HQ538_04075 [Parcubacteria group bacterium]|nr:hypothetical protein [Parcubacteria group bacterium]